MRSPFLRRRTPLDALKRLIGIRENAVNRGQEVFKGFGRRELDSYQAHGNTKPAELQRVLCVNLDPKIKLNSLRLVPCSKAHQKNLPFDVCGRRRGFF